MRCFFSLVEERIVRSSIHLAETTEPGYSLFEDHRGVMRGLKVLFVRDGRRAPFHVCLPRVGREELHFRARSPGVIACR